MACFGFRGAFVVLIAPLLLAAGAAGQTAGENPFTSPTDLAAGERMYQSQCAICHGRSGRGGLGPDLTRGELRHGASDAALFRVIRRGLPGTDMPGHYQGEQMIWQTVAFVRSLSAAGSEVEVAGDPDAGRRIFHEQEDCAQCHGVGGRGTRGIPPLDEIGWSRAPSHLRTSLVDPDADVDPRWWTVRLTDADGEAVTGWRLDEDRYSVRLLDADNNLRSFQKGDLRDFQRLETSMMSSYDALSESDLDDLVAYLYSLRGSAR